MLVEADPKTIVFLCDQSGIAARPWVAAGFDAVLVDVAIEEGVSVDGRVRRVGCDVRTLQLRGRPLGVVAWFPCTHFANVGASSWPVKGRGALIEALSIADACLRIAVRSRAAWWMCENPVGRLTHYWGPPDHVFSPHEYGGWLDPEGDHYTKRTCLWTGGTFTMPERRPVTPWEGSLVGVVGNVDRRSETPRGFARALFETMRPGDALRPRVPLRAPDPLRAPHVSLWGEPLPAIETFPAGDSFSDEPGPSLAPPLILPCEWCGQEFHRGRADQRFCTALCRVQAHRGRKAQPA